MAALNQRLTRSRRPAASSIGGASRVGTSLEAARRLAPGNQLSQRMLQDKVVQPKLTVNAPGDEFEREADEVADRVMRMPDPRVGRPPAIQRACAHCQKELKQERVQRMCSECEEELHRKPRHDRAGPEIRANLEAEITSIRNAGEPLPKSVREFFEPRFAHDFGDVRVHTSGRAAETARDVDALAYTIRNHIVFAPGWYAPGSAAGRSLLAHELTHTIQQGEGRSLAGEMIPRLGDLTKLPPAPTHVVPQRRSTAGLTRRPAEGTLQRLCGPRDIGTPGGCTPESSEPVGDLVLFRFNCDEFASGAEQAKVVGFADSMTTGDRVKVHGLASTDGDPVFNHNLSCARALRAFGVLTANGIAPGQIDVSEHGPTPGPAAQRRSVVLERDPGVSRPTVPQLRAVIDVGPTPGNCGVMNFVIHWEVSRNSEPVNGGFVVQDITFAWRNVDCTGTEVPDASGKLSPLHYFEAWRVLPGSTAFDPLDGNTDTFSWINDDPSGCTTDRVTVTATATYHDNVAALPAHMTRANAATFAGGLQSSLADPAVDGNVSRPVPHGLVFHWGCCPCVSSPTVVDSHVP